MIDLTPEQFPWMKNKAMSALFGAFPKDNLRFVGGCVRNALWGEPVTDTDLAVALEPDEVMSALEKAGIRYIETGVSHGTVTAIIDKKPYEITSLRRDIDTDGRHAVVTYTKNWSEDAQRRDLTFNALYASQSGEVFDPTGLGLEDLKDRRLRFVGEADRRVKEDYLRILRFFRFLAWYGGEAKVDADSLKACRENKAGIKKLSAERVWSEIKKLLLAQNPSRALHIMLTNDILETVLPEANNVDGLDFLLNLENREGLKPDPLLRLMAMSAREPLQMALLCKRLKMSGAETKRLRNWAEDGEPLSLDLSDRDRLAALYRAGGQTVSDRTQLRAAGEKDPIKSAQWMTFANFAQAWERPKFPLSGKDLKAAGVEPGPRMGKALKALEALWIRSGFTADKDKLLTALKLLG